MRREYFFCLYRYWMLFCKSHKRCIVSVFIWQIVSMLHQQIVSTLQAHKSTPFHSIWNEIHCDMTHCCYLPNDSLCSLICARLFYSASGQMIFFLVINREVHIKQFYDSFIAIMLETSLRNDIKWCYTSKIHWCWKLLWAPSTLYISMIVSFWLGRTAHIAYYSGTT